MEIYVLLPSHPCLLPSPGVSAAGSLAGFGHDFGSCKHGSASPVALIDTNRINVNLWVFEGEGGSFTVTVIIVQYSSLHFILLLFRSY